MPKNGGKSVINMNTNRGKLTIVALLIGICLAGITLFVYILHTVPEFNQYRLVREFDGRFDDEEVIGGAKRILLWNDFFGDARWGLTEDMIGPSYFRDELRCPVYNCDLTHFHDFVPDITMFDAVIFHSAQPFPFLKKAPHKRIPQQSYVFALMEPPGETKHILSDEGGFYNLTMTYRLDSDITWPYQQIVDIETGGVIAPAKFPKWRTPTTTTTTNDSTLLNLWSGKTKTAAWFVSHCETLSKREKLADELKKHIDVDIYGKCGSLSCPRNSDKCDKLLDEKYKFYFAFENSLCTDYVSEKFFNAFQRKIVPIVFGGADYSRFAPPHSYINAEDFDSINHLVEYLRYLSENPEKYFNYFWWRQYYRIEFHSPFCDLCERLHSPNALQKTQNYRNIEKWWLRKSCRFTTKILN